jgi:tRNA threonylcarbamoyladenosine biosynthesis protein TsaE
MRVETRSPEETEALGRRLGEACEPGAVLALVGDLGAGKTCFVRGLARGLGIPERITSPTFVLMNRYEGRLKLAHLDLYRLESPDLAALGWHDLKGDHVLAAEWADKAADRDLGDALRISFEVTGENARRLMFEARGPRSRALLGGLNLSA